MQQQNSPLWPIQRDPHKFLALIATGRSTADYAKNSQIFAQDAVADSVFYIQNGRVKVTVASDQGKEATIAILEAGQFFGEACLNDQTHRIATTIALTDCRITTIEKEAMREALNNQPLFSKFFMDHLLNRNIRIESDIIDQLFNSSEKRLARLLLLLANYGRGDGQPIVPVTLSQETLAEMIGTTRSRVSFFMNKFRRLGFIDYNGKITVHVSLLASILHDVPEIRQNDSAENEHTHPTMWFNKKNEAGDSGGGNDTITVGNGVNTINGGLGNDTVISINGASR